MSCRKTTISVHVYGALLYLYPASFRRQFGNEMVCDFQDQTVEAWAIGGVAGLLSFWLSVARDLIASLARQWLRLGTPAGSAAWAISLGLIAVLQGSTKRQADIPPTLTADQETNFMLVGLAVVVLLIVATVLVTTLFWISVLKRRSRA